MRGFTLYMKVLHYLNEFIILLSPSLLSYLRTVTSANVPSGLAKHRGYAQKKHKFRHQTYRRMQFSGRHLAKYLLCWCNVLR